MSSAPAHHHLSNQHPLLLCPHGSTWIAAAITIKECHCQWSVWQQWEGEEEERRREMPHHSKFIHPYQNLIHNHHQGPAQATDPSHVVSNECSECVLGFIGSCCYATSAVDTLVCSSIHKTTKYLACLCRC